MMRRGAVRVHAPHVERMLFALGAESPLAADVAGDIADEYAHRATEGGVGAAAWWCVQEVTRTAPYLLRSAVRHGTIEGRARLATWSMAPLVLSMCVWLAIVPRNVLVPPLRQLSMKPWFNFVPGSQPEDMHLGGIGNNGLPVTRVSADIHIDDSRVAALDGTRIRPKAPGRTFVSVHSGTRSTRAAVTVFEPVRTLDGLRADQRYVLATVSLRGGQSVHWPLPAGYFSLVNHVNSAGAAPDVIVSGSVTCMPAPAPGVYRTFCRASESDAVVTLYNPASATTGLVGALALERETHP